MAKKLSKLEIKKIANLARLELNEKEIDIYSSQLSDILEYVGKLQEVDTENVRITSQVTGLSNVMREDKAVLCDDAHELIRSAPETKDNLIKVKSVF